MTYKELGKKVLEQAKKPLSAKEIWEEACKMGWDKELSSIGKTPWDTLFIQISERNIKEEGIEAE